MARKKKRFRPGSTATAPEIAPPAAVEAQDSVAQAPARDDVESGESLAPAPASPADSEAAPATDSESSDQPLPSATETAPAVDSLPADQDVHTPAEVFEAVDDAVAAPPSRGPADHHRTEVGLPTEPIHQGAEPTDDPVTTEAVPAEQAHESFSPTPDEHAHPAEPLPATEPLSAERDEEAYPAEPFPATERDEEVYPAEPLPATERDEEAYPAEPLPDDEPDDEPLTPEDESAPEPARTLATPAVPAPDVVDSRPAVMGQTTDQTTDQGPAQPVDGPVSKPVQGAAAWRRLLRMGLPRATKANLLGGLLAVLLGLAIATQVQLTQERGLSQLSQTDLIRVLDDVSLRSSRLDAQIRELEATRDRLRSGTGSSAEALEQAQKRVDTLGILAGTVAATGPGVVITLNDPDQALTGPIILDLIQELRDAGAEAIDVGGVRVVASSFVAEVDGDIAIDDIRVTRPIAIKAIGDAKTLSSAMTIPGGIVETVRQKKASAKVVEQETIEITSLHTAEDLKNARVVE